MRRRKSLALVLGGGADRERRCVQAGFRPKQPIWLSGPALTDNCLNACAAAGCDLDYLLVDYRAMDTLANFTTLLEDMMLHGFTDVVVVTSAVHAPRAMAIAKVVLPRRGIYVSTPIIVRSGPEERHESTWLVWRDVIRANLWALLGVDVTAPLVRFFHPDRIAQRDRRVRDFTYHGRRCFG